MITAPNSMQWRQSGGTEIFSWQGDSRLGWAPFYDEGAISEIMWNAWSLHHRGIHPATGSCRKFYRASRWLLRISSKGRPSTSAFRSRWWMRRRWLHRGSSSVMLGQQWRWLNFLCWGKQGFTSVGGHSRYHDIEDYGAAEQDHVTATVRHHQGTLDTWVQRASCISLRPIDQYIYIYIYMQFSNDLIL